MNIQHGRSKFQNQKEVHLSIAYMSKTHRLYNAYQWHKEEKDYMLMQQAVARHWNSLGIKNDFS